MMLKRIIDNRWKFKKVFIVAVLILLLLITVSTVFYFLFRDNNENKPKEIIRQNPLTLEAEGDISLITNSSSNRKNSIIIGVEILTGKIDPVSITSSSTQADTVVSKSIYEPLIMPEEDGTPRMCLAESYSVSEDGLVYTFKIKENVKFSDGNILNAADVYGTYEALCILNSETNAHPELTYLEGYADFMSKSKGEISGIKVMDDNNISFTFTKKLSGLIWVFTTGIARADNMTAKESETLEDVLKKERLNPVGTGAYKMLTYVDGLQAILKVNENYHKTVGTVKEITFMSVTESEAEIKFLNEEIDIYCFGDEREIFDMAERLKYVDVYSYQGNKRYYMSINCKDEALSDISVRQALNYGFDKEKVLKELYDTTAKVNQSPFFADSYASSQDINKYEFNRETAIQLLENAGYKLNGEEVRQKGDVKLEFELMTYNSAIIDHYAQAFVKDMKEIGIAINVKKLGFSDTVSIQAKGTYDLYITQFISGLSLDLINRFSLPPEGKGYEGWYNEEIKNLLEKCDYASVFEDNKEDFLKFSEKYNAEVPQIPLLQENNYILCNPRIKGLRFSIYTGIYESLNSLYILKEDKTNE